ncbi:unnamed protein product, partial [Urochloa humidicola]
HHGVTAFDAPSCEKQRRHVGLSSTMVDGNRTAMLRNLPIRKNRSHTSSHLARASRIVLFPPHDPFSKPAAATHVG